MNDTNSAAATAAALPPLRTRGDTEPGATRRRRPGRAIFVQWVRKTHGWFGLWGATIGLVFGVSGIWLNHRAVLKLPPVAQQRSNTQIALPEPAPGDAQALAAWLQTALQLDAPATLVRVEPARPVPWAERPRGSAAPGGFGDDAGPRRPRGDRAEERSHPERGNPVGGGASAGAADGAAGLMQPEHWMVNFGGPQATIQAETWAGNRSVSVRRVDNGLIGTLMNLHKGIGMPVAWILLVDTLAGSLVFLSLSGLVLWVMTHRRRAVGYAIFGVGCVLTVGLALSRG